MNRWRLSKYDPALRDARGAYTLDEWTAASDIGRSFADGVLTVEEYLRVESAHVQAVQAFLDELGATGLGLQDLCDSEGQTLAGTPTPAALASVQGVIDECQERLLSENALPRVPFDVAAVDRAHLSGAALEAALRLCFRDALWSNLGAPGVFTIRFGYDFLFSIEAAEACPEAQRRVTALGLFLEPSPAAGG